MNEGVFICSLADLSDPGSRGFSLQHQQQLINGFIVLKGGHVYAYRNICPHTGSPLDWVEHQFLDLDQEYIQCASHDARFELESGRCIAGPCAGDALKKLNVVQQEQSIYLLEPDPF